MAQTPDPVTPADANRRFRLEWPGNGVTSRSVASLRPSAAEFLLRWATQEGLSMLKYLGPTLSLVGALVDLLGNTRDEAKIVPAFLDSSAPFHTR